TRAAAQFKYFLSYGQAEEDCIDVLIMDEAHRIRATTASRYTPKDKRSGLAQIEELLKAAKVSVFFIDDLQVVKPDEIGSVSYIADFATRHNCKIFDYELEAQFRCQGSEAFVNWINNTLDVRKTANVIWDIDENFEFKIFDSPFDLENAIKNKVASGATARVAAGFCWKWSDPNPDGTLVDDVVIGSFKRPWDAKHDAKKLAPGIPKASFWAYDPNGINQIGCVYTAQGFEFDYVGVIFGRDLYYEPDEATWKGRRSLSADPNVKKAKTDEQFMSLVKNTYRVLLSRGIKGCYVHFLDPETKNFFKSRMDFKKPASITEYRETQIEKEVDAKLKYREYLPVFSLEAAATRFGKEEQVEEIGWVKINAGRRLTETMFVAKVIGKSMEPTIPENSFCIFRFDRGGTRDNLVVLVESSRIIDPELTGKYSVKRYHSEKEIFDDGTWRHKVITLSPDNKDFEPIVLKDVPAGDFRIVAEFIGIVD
ncbi:MAG TPA: DNA/RNA helicase domain-containing protein, partial [Candidatus Binatia bacterium]